MIVITFGGSGEVPTIVVTWGSALRRLYQCSLVGIKDFFPGISENETTQKGLLCCSIPWGSQPSGGRALWDTGG
eukprot:221707-Amphidinium_carterae.1